MRNHTATPFFFPKCGLHIIDTAQFFICQTVKMPKEQSRNLGDWLCPVVFCQWVGNRCYLELILTCCSSNCSSRLGTCHEQWRTRKKERDSSVRPSPGFSSLQKLSDHLESSTATEKLRRQSMHAARLRVTTCIFILHLGIVIYMKTERNMRGADFLWQTSRRCIDWMKNYFFSWTEFCESPTTVISVLFRRGRAAFWLKIPSNSFRRHITVKRAGKRRLSLCLRVNRKKSISNNLFIRNRKIPNMRATSTDTDRTHRSWLTVWRHHFSLDEGDSFNGFWRWTADVILRREINLFSQDSLYRC